MRVPRSRLMVVVTLLTVSACAGNWVSELERPVPCFTPRDRVEGWVTDTNRRIDAGYAWVEFDANAFNDSTRVQIRPYPALHGIQITLPTQNAMPAFTVGFPVDYCGDRSDDEPYYIVTERGRQPARVVNGVAVRRVDAGEMSRGMRDAAIIRTTPPLISGFVILSN